MVGQVLLHYEILEKLGEGGMGVVYKARDTRLARYVAIKVLPPEAIENSERKQRFLQEARTASSLNYAGIVTIHDIGEASGVLFIVMEYVAGQTLQALIGRGGLQIADALKYAIQITDALSKAHAVGVIHRDLKPANVMVIDGQIKILDFGVAKLVERVPDGAQLTKGDTATLSATQEGTLMGTAAYMSPEQAEGKLVDARSDIFSFGTVLYEMVTGQRAFQGDTSISVLSAVLRDEPKPVSAISPRVPRDVERIIARCLRKDPARRFQHAQDVKLALEDIKEEYDTGTLAARPPAPKPYRRYVLAGVFLTAILVLALSVRLSQRQPPPTAAPMTRLTSDSGSSDFPALSPDGKLLAFASDRAGQNNLDLWIKQVPSGEPLHLTRHQSDEYEPKFSPDGTRLVYRSEQEGGGIYIMPALGGQPRLLAKRGRNPRFSPDGSQILYRVTSSSDGVWGDIFVVPTDGGVPRQIQSEFPIAYGPLWTPDGKHILYWGATKHEAPYEAFDWWVAPVAGGNPIQTGAGELLRKQNLRVGPPGAWVPGENRIVFDGYLGSDWSIWQIPIAPGTWRIESPAQELTPGTGNESSPAVAVGGLLAFNSFNWNTDIWAAPLDANTGRTTGELQRLTQDSAQDLLPTVSMDGTKVAFLSDRGARENGKFNVWLKDVPTGRETPLTFTGDVAFFGIISGDGKRVAYPNYEQGNWKTYTVATDGANPERICGDCGQARGWSPDQRSIIGQRGGPLLRLVLMDPASQKTIDFLRHPTAALYSAQFSPDGRWVAFGARFKPGDERLFIVPNQNGNAPQDESKWVPITSGPALDNKPRWSPDGNLLYFTSDRDEYNCVWAQRLDPATKRPRGAAFSVLHFHGAVRSMAKSGSVALEIAVARDKLVFHLDEARGNIWMTQLPKD